MFKSWFCKHKYILVRTIHGDEIIGSGWKRSIWRCDICSKLRTSEYLDKL